MAKEKNWDVHCCKSELNAIFFSFARKSCIGGATPQKGVLNLVVSDEEDLCGLFDVFEPVTVGYFDQKMFDLYSTFHYIFVGKKRV